MHPLNRRAPIKAQTHGIGDQVVDAQRDVELPRQGVNMEAAGAQEPCIIQADEALQPTFKGTKRTRGIFLRKVLSPSP